MHRDVVTFLYHEVSNNPNTTGFLRKSNLPYKHKEEDVEAQILLAKELQFKSLETGCVKIDVFRDYLLVEFYNTDKQILYTFKIKKV